MDGSLLPSVAWNFWLVDTKSIRRVITIDAVLAWLSVWSEVQIIFIRSSWCHCHPIISCFTKIQNGSAFWVLAYPGCHGTEAVKGYGMCYVDVLISLLWFNVSWYIITTAVAQCCEYLLLNIIVMWLSRHIIEYLVLCNTIFALKSFSECWISYHVYVRSQC